MPPPAPTLVVDGSPVTEVRYKGVSLTRDRANSAATGLTVTNAAKVLTVAEGVSADGGSAPWAVTTGEPDVRR